VGGITAPDIVRICREAGVGTPIELELGREHISVKGEIRRVHAVVEGVGDQLQLSGFQPYRSLESAWARVSIGGISATFHQEAIGITTPHHFESDLTT
jgi:hypothetical protein